MQQKYCIAKQINSGQSTSKEISDRLNIKINRVNVISRKIKFGKTLYSKSGRPRALDCESDKSLNLFIDALKKQSHLTIERAEKEIKNKIKDEFIKTKERKDKLDDTKNKLIVPQRALLRYFNNYKLL